MKASEALELLEELAIGGKTDWIDFLEHLARREDDDDNGPDDGPDNDEPGPPPPDSSPDNFIREVERFLATASLVPA